MVDEILTVLFYEEHFGNEFARGIGKPLLPDNRRGSGALEHGDRPSPREIALFSLVLLTDSLKVLFGNDTFQPLTKISNVPFMIDCGRCVHEVVHNRIDDVEDFHIGHAFQFH